jgi:transketolase
MNQPVIYVLTHDSIFVGEDGPTHQPIEHLASFRAMPNLRVLRPADAEETAEAWAMAMERTEGPTALALSRQNITVFPKSDPDWKSTIRTGAYVAKQCEGVPDAVIIATGSEVGLALEAAVAASSDEKSQGKRIRVVSMISKELFESQPAAIRDAIVPPSAQVFVCEAGVRFGWERWAKTENILSIDRFGESGPAAKVAEHLGMTSLALSEQLQMSNEK